MKRTIQDIRIGIRVVLNNPECHEARVLHWAENAKTLLNELDLANSAGAGVVSLLRDVQRDCIEARKSLRDLLALMDHEVNVGDFSNGVTDESGSIDQGQVAAQTVIDSARRLFG